MDVLEIVIVDNDMICNDSVIEIYSLLFLDELSEILEKLTSNDPVTEDSDIMLQKLSQELAGKSKAAGDNSSTQENSSTSSAVAVTTTAASSSNTDTDSNDRIVELAGIVKNLIEVNQLAYLQLQQQIRENQSS